MLRSDNSLKEKPVREEENDRPGIYEDLSCDSKADIAWVACPCYPQSHRDQSDLAKA
jgi:hypothetical protein